MIMNRVASSDGFTIVESMIVLAVTGIMFVAVSAGWSGRQRSSAYQTAVRDTSSMIQQSISDVTNGYFPSTTNFSCTSSGGPLSFGTSGRQGGNDKCIFLGKSIEFSSEGGGPVQMYKYTVAGYAGASGTKPTEWQATIAPRLTDKVSAPSDLELLSIKVAGRPDYTGIAIITDIGTTEDGRLLSGEQPVKLYGMIGSPGTGPFMTDVPGDAAGIPLTTTNFDDRPITTEITMCFKSLGTGKYGLIKFGGGGSLTDMTIETKQGGC
jgi:prepilin-type N-terminal cleavage/methylation domain-containing protein